MKQSVSLMKKRGVLYQILIVIMKKIELIMNM